MTRCPTLTTHPFEHTHASSTCPAYVVFQHRWQLTSAACCIWYTLFELHFELDAVLWPCKHGWLLTRSLNHGSVRHSACSSTRALSIDVAPERIRQLACMQLHLKCECHGCMLGASLAGQQRPDSKPCRITHRLQLQQPFTQHPTASHWLSNAPWLALIGHRTEFLGGFQSWRCSGSLVGRTCAKLGQNATRFRQKVHQSFWRGPNPRGLGAGKGGKFSKIRAKLQRLPSENHQFWQHSSQHLKLLLQKCSEQPQLLTIGTQTINEDYATGSTTPNYPLRHRGGGVWSSHYVMQSYMRLVGARCKVYFAHPCATRVKRAAITQ